MKAIDLWAQCALDNKATEGKILGAMLKEGPMILSVLFERTCNLSCQHCIYPNEKSSAGLSKQVGLHDIVVGMAKQMPEGSDMIHAGRIFRREHLRTLAAVREARGDMGVGMIDNGSFGKHVSFIRESGFRFTWLDISVDGDEASHNAQRRNASAYAMARTGIQTARVVADKVTSLMTLTALNSGTVRSVGELLMSGEVDELHFTPMSPYRELNKPLEMESAHFREAFEQIARLSALRPGKVFLRLYRIEDFMKLASAIGHSKLWQAFDQGTVDLGRIFATVDGVEVAFLPLSIWPQEEVVIDADGTYRLAGSGQYRLDEYRKGKDRVGATISHYSSNRLTAESDLIREYRAAARKWWLFHGKRHLEKEVSELKRISGS